MVISQLGFSSAARFRCLMATGGNNLNLILGGSYKPYKNRMQTMLISRKISSLHVVGSLQGQSSGETPPLISKPDDGELPNEGSDSSSVTGSVVALGKFDALHLGHRELAIQASKAGKPFLVSFVGMAEVLGWAPRAPIVAKCDRKRVLSLWAPYCDNVAPGEFSVEFSSVRQLSPRQFVEKLSKELGVRGVVAGEYYRFGYKAAGNTKELVKLCEEYGMGAYIVSNVMDHNQLPGDTNSKTSQEKGQVSSTRVRHALAEGDMEYVAELLGRKHRLILTTSEQEALVTKGKRLSAPKSCFLNLAPKDGLYENCQLFIDNTIQVPCKAIIDSTHIHIESDEEGTWMQIAFQDSQPIGIEFGGSIVGL